MDSSRIPPLIKCSSPGRFLLPLFAGLSTAAGLAFGQPDRRVQIAVYPTIPERQSMPRIQTRAFFLLVFATLLASSAAQADGLSAVKECESDTSRPEDAQKLSILPNGETRGSDTAATLIKMAKQKAKEGKDTEAIQWAALCQFEMSQQEAIKRDSSAVLQYLKQ